MVLVSRLQPFSILKMLPSCPPACGFLPGSVSFLPKILKIFFCQFVYDCPDLVSTSFLRFWIMVL